MRRFPWSKFYPADWQREFGQEFDALNEQRPVGIKSGMDILTHASAAHFVRLGDTSPMMFGWLAIAFLNVYATEVQWSAGALLLCGAIATLRAPRRWLRNALVLFTAIPVSSLYFYQIPGIHHEPLYKTAVALVPALIGSAVGLALRSVGLPPVPEKMV